MELSRDAFINVWTRGIRRDIEVLLAAEGYRGACALTLAGIDAMAFVSMPETQLDVKPADFIAWADRYLDFGRDERVTGLELYGARCAMLHTYSTQSKLSRNGTCRQVLWCDRMIPRVKSHPDHPDLVMVAVHGLAEIFFESVPRFLIESFASAARAPLTEKRLQSLVHHLPVEPES